MLEHFVTGYPATDTCEKALSNRVPALFGYGILEMKFKDLLRQAQFHGAKILVDTRFSWYWTLSLVVLFCSSIMVLSATVNRFLAGPTHIVQTAIIRKSMLFPTVIVCPEISYPQYKTDEFIKEIKYPPSTNSTYIRSVLKQFAAFSSPDVVFNVEDLERIQDLLDYNGLDIENTSLRLTPSCEEILLKCRWLQNIVNCSSLFRMEITRAGYCCVFNGRSLKREIRERSQQSFQANKQKYYVEDIQYSNSLMVAVQQRQDLFDIDLVYKWVALRAGYHYVDITVNGTAVSPGQEVWFSYKTRTMQVSEETVSLSSELRHCHLANEPLKYFSIYHKTYCLLECEMERTLKRCQCLKLTHPSFPGIPLCRAQHLKCSRDATVSFAIDECDCPPTCNVEIEEAVVYATDLVPDSPTYDDFYDGLDLERISVVRVFVPKRIENAYQRKSYFTTFNLFSQLGGVFNLFFGCSILTLLEMALLAWKGAQALYNDMNALE